MSLRYASELATVLVVRKKDDRNEKTSHLILEMSMNEAFIWLSGLRFIDQKKYEPLHVGYNYYIFSGPPYGIIFSENSEKISSH